MNAEQFREAYSRGVRSFGGVDLSGIDLSHGSFPEVDLAGANLERANLTECDLREANLEHARLDRCVLRRAKLRSARLNYAGMANVDAVEAILTKAHMAQVHAHGAQLLEADLRASDLTGAYFSDANFSGAVLRSAILERVNFTNADLSAGNRRYVVGAPLSLLACRITSGTCELSDWNRATISLWMQRGAQLTRWGLPDDSIPTSTDEGQRRKALKDLLLSLFDRNDLEIYVGTNLPEIEAQLPFATAPLQKVAYDMTVALEKKGLITDTFFNSLQYEAPNRRSDIMSVARLWLALE